MRLPRFKYVEPKALDEACGLLRDEPKARALAGGTDLLVNMKHRIEIPEVLVNLKKIQGLSSIEQKQGRLEIGALVSLKALYRSELARRYPILAQAASNVGSYHHQVMGTVGGNLCQQNRCQYLNQSRQWRKTKGPCYKTGDGSCHVTRKAGTCYATYCGDLAPALLVLDAAVRIQGPEGAREIPLPELYTGEGRTPLSLKAGEILTHVLLDLDGNSENGVYIKWSRRGSIDFPIVGIALRLGEGRQPRIAFTAVDRKPIRAEKTESFFEDKELTEDLLEEAKGVVSREASPVRNSSYSPSHKREMMGILLKLAIDACREEGAAR